MKWGEKEEHRFQVLHQIESKPSQKVELVRDRNTGCECIKRVFFEDKREVYEKLADIHSAFLPKIYAVYFDENTTILEEYVKGSTLEEYVKQHKLSRKEIKTIFLQLCDGISHLHEKGIVHRDIKPANIIISDKGSFVLIDFDIARIHRDGSTSDTQNFGTRGYAAPEQFGFSQSDSRTDIFSLGKTMQYLMECNEYHGYLSGIVDKCIAFDPEKRYQTIQAVKEKIQRKNRKRIFIIFCIALCVTGGMAMYGKDSRTDKMQKDNIYTEQTEEGNNQPDTDEQEYVSHLISLQEDCEYTLISNGEEKEIVYEKFRRKQDLAIKVSIQMHRLMISCQMAGETFKRSLSFDTPDDKSYSDTKIDGELLFVDMNQDGTKEILVVLSDRIVLEGANNTMLQNTNGVRVWCVGWDKEFFIAKNSLFSQDGNFIFGNLCNYGIYSGDDMNLYVLSGEEIVSKEEQTSQ